MTIEKMHAAIKAHDSEIDTVMATMVFNGKSYTFGVAVFDIDGNLHGHSSQQTSQAFAMSDALKQWDKRNECKCGCHV